MIIPEWDLVDSKGVSGVNSVSMVGRIVGHEWAAWISTDVPVRMEIAPRLGIEITPEEPVESETVLVDALVGDRLSGMIKMWRTEIMEWLELEDVRALAQIRTLVTPRRILDTAEERFPEWEKTGVGVDNL